MKPLISFELSRIKVPLDRILPIRVITDPQKKIRRYKEIVSTIRVAGLIEPLMVYPEKGGSGNYVLTDGHLRLLACKELGMKEVDCIVALDDESYIYNAKVNRLAPIQERRMILKVLESGVSIERIAEAFNEDVRQMRARINVTKGLCSEVVEMLKDKQMSPHALKLLRQAVPSRQIEMVELMVAANNYTKIYVEALLIGTPKSKLASPRPKAGRKIKPEDMAKMEMEMESLGKEYKACEDVFAKKMLLLTVFRRYVVRLMENEKINRFIKSRHSGIHAELEAIVASETVC
ncbi:ParB N-terminal domain-containing protein [Luteolibacter sp. GHJ8]|uniref:ParB N-terminal domain-containing protein n=1 Tax=Luteolibacter rhizosphaerae TaxID=2989719 RepID=A0ABT3FZA5_9BACT|nr:plasmid partitioning protein RepB C-terminal domain-containing protein [Luteolibacter rhizosphaerae]MCW1912915.1 ParB N-terminal domain-containing protein [Luteolibacter rhizosphaerae]